MYKCKQEYMKAKEIRDEEFVTNLSSKTMTELFGKEVLKPPSNVEIVQCQKCGHSQTLGNEPFHRLPRKYRHYRLDDNVAMALKRYCIPYGSINNGLSMLLFKVQRLEEEEL